MGMDSSTNGTHGAPERARWGSRLGFILAATGSAIGLGNIWRFPTETGENGGAAFVLIYLVCVLFIGLPVMVGELALGRRSGRNPVGAFRALAKGPAWVVVGGLSVITGLMILSYYGVVAGWTLGYTVKLLTGELAQAKGAEQSQALFGEFVSNGPSMVLYLAMFIGMTASVVAGGVRCGIERCTKFLMPLLLILLVALVIRSVTLEGAEVGLRFLLAPDFSKVSWKTVVAALGQAFFSLSLGMGAMITYGSYLSREDNLVHNALWVALADTGVALLAGLAIFPALFSVPGLEAAAGPGLIFVVLPNLFHAIPGGMIFGAAFFFLLVIAALTSTISLMEVVVAYLVDEHRWGRPKAALGVAALCFMLGVPSAMSLGAMPSLSAVVTLPALGAEGPGKIMGFLDLMDLIFGNLSLVVGALATAVFVGFFWMASHLREEVGGEATPKIFHGWRFLVRWVCPGAILVILINLVITTLSS